MPAPFPVELKDHDPAWAEQAYREAARLMTAMGRSVIAVHHIGSTAIPGIRAKPILDLMPVVSDLAEFEKLRPAVEDLGYVWWGEYGLEGRRYCTLDDPLTVRRQVQLHCYGQGSSEITRHLAFRDYLRSHPDLAHAYDMEKVRCRDRHPLDSHAYGDCKSALVQKIEAEALSTLVGKA
ncbi:MAG TPA: GrpB family protein [Rhizomicrobium sp.]|nr:GrpB family protein [Rhizomicrobium sp.]